MVRHVLAAGAGFALAALLPLSGVGAQSDAAVQRAIRDSIAAYSGSCPCPYSVDRAGRRCGARSAYSRPGGARPLCYPGDVRGRGRR